MSVELVLFFILAAAAVATALFMILRRNPVMSAISLIGNFFCLAALYLLLQAQLLAVLQVVVYTGAIMVLVVFVIMLLNLGDEQGMRERFDLKRVVGVVLGAGFLLEMLFIIGFGEDQARVLQRTMPPEAAAIGTVESMGNALFGRFLLPFEVTSILLLAAIVGAVVLAKRRPN